MKFLRRFCSEQVQILLERMDDHWVDEFAIEGSKWEPMLPYGKAFEQFTRIEQKCIRATAQEQTTKLKKERAYTGILERTMSQTKTRWDFDDEKHGRISRDVAMQKEPTQMLTSASMRKQMEAMLNQQFRDEYAKSYTGTLHEHAQLHNQKAQAQNLHQYMRNVDYELGRANSIEELKVLMTKQQFLMDHEKAAIEHQQFLKQHAPRGYL
jgi:flagellar motor switch/type III secretory pathway protein FliN